MENDAIADEILSVLKALLEAAGPEWTLEALGALLQEVGGGGEMPPEAMPQGAPGAMPPANNMDPMSRALMGKR